MRSFFIHAALLIASATASQVIYKRQTGSGAFVPETEIIATCSAENLTDCGSDFCYDPAAGETCCAEGYACPANSACIGTGFCCPEGTDAATCIAQNGLTGNTDESSSTTSTSTSTRSSSSSSSSPSVTEVNGAGRTLASFGALLVGGGAAAVLAL